MKDNYLSGFLFLVIVLQNYTTILSFTTPPKSLKKIKILFTSPFEISSEKPIIASNNVFFVSDNKFKAIDLEKIYDKNFKESYDILGGKYKNPLAYTLTNNGLNIFFSKGNKLEMWEEDFPNKFEDMPIFEGEFNQFNCEKHNDSIKIGFCHQNGKKENYEIAIYNKWSKKVLVLNLVEIDKNVSQNNILADLDMENNIAQSLIFYRYDYDKRIKTKLIAIDQQGNIKIWNIGIFTEEFSKGFVRYENPLSRSFSLNESCPELLYNQDIAGLIGPNKDILLYLGKKNLTLIHLDKGQFYMDVVKIINPIKNPLSILALDDGDVLIGTKEGLIYLIEYDYLNKKINILDKYNICKNSPVKHITYDTSCPKNDERCYIFAVNCGNLKIFKIASEKNLIIEYKWIIALILFICFTAFFVIRYNCRKKSKDDKKEEEVELTEK